MQTHNVKIKNKNRSLNKYKRQNNISRSLSNYGVSVIACTCRAGFIDNLFANYNRQKYKPKELIIVLNDDSLNLEEWKRKAKKYNNIKVYKCSESYSLGKCLNYAVEKSNYPYIAKFDDDDYYSSEYLSDSIKVFKRNNKIGVIGKATFFVYFEKNKILALKRVDKENTSGAFFLTGATLIFKKRIFEKVKFADISLGEDDRFVMDCIKKGIQTFSSDRFNFVYIRYGAKSHHTYKIDNKDYMKGCDLIMKTDNFIDFIMRKNNL